MVGSGDAHDPGTADLFGGGPFKSLAAAESVVVVEDTDDLPAASSGTRTLADSTTYLFTDFVTDTAGLEFGTNTSLVGISPAAAGFIHVGGATALSATGENVYIDGMYVHAPSGTVMDLDGGASDDLHVLNTAFGDLPSVGLGDASIGTITGYRVPSFKGCNFEGFDSGLTFDGTMDKVFIQASPFRNVTAAGVTCVEFTATASLDIVDIVDCFVKNVQSDTEVVTVDPSATISDIFQYRGVTHDNTVTESNVLAGAASRDTVGYLVRDSYPLTDSTVIGQLTWSGTAQTVTGSGTSATEMTPATTLAGVSERTSESSDGVLQYDGKRNRTVVITGAATVTGVNSTVELTAAKNGVPLVNPGTVAVLKNAADTETASVTGRVDLTTGDNVSVFVENIGGTADVGIESLVLSI